MGSHSPTFTEALARFNTCFHISASKTNFLIDCGASALIAMRRFGVEPKVIATIFLPHLHGDHSGPIWHPSPISMRDTSRTVQPKLMETLLPMATKAGSSARQSATSLYSGAASHRDHVGAAG